MTMLNERYSDLLAEDADPDTKILVHDLDAIFLIPAPPAVRTSTAAILMAQAAGPRSQPTRRRGFPTLRLAALAGAAALAMASMLAYMHQRLAPVSAETILRRAMAANTLPPNRTTHLVYAVAGQPSGSGTFDVWRAAGADGSIVRMAVTFTIRTPLSGTAPQHSTRGKVFMVQRAVLKHGRGQVYTFNPHANTVAIRPATMHDLDVGGLSLFDPNRLARQMLAAGTATESHLHLLPQKSLVGHIVDAVQTDWSGPETDRGRYTLYFDSRTHLFVGLDLQGRERGQSQAGTFRVATDQTMLNSAVPKDTFAFRPPRRAHVVPGP